jgi:hypothetical protein
VDELEGKLREREGQL